MQSCWSLPATRHNVEAASRHVVDNHFMSTESSGRTLTPETLRYPQEGISTIITAISRSRMIFRRLETYIIYRIASSLLILGFFFFAIVILEFEIPTWVLVRPPCRSLACRQHVQYVLDLGDCACAPDVASMWPCIPFEMCIACSHK